MKLTLPTDSAERKGVPIMTGCIEYFPAALAGVAAHSKTGNDKHNPGQELHHSRGKSSDHADCIVRHLLDLADMLALYERTGGNELEDGSPMLTEANALCWRALALSQELHEKFNNVPLAPRAREAETAVAELGGCPIQVSTFEDGPRPGSAIPGAIAEHWCPEHQAMRPLYSIECADCKRIIYGAQIATSIPPQS